MLVKKKKKNGEFRQLCFTDISLSTGDVLYKNGVEYARVAGESGALYFLQRFNSDNAIASPYHKDALIENILFGVFTLKDVNFK